MNNIPVTGPRPLAFVVTALLMLTAALSPTQVWAEEQKTRQITFETLGVEIDVPTTWELMVNERASAFFRAYITNASGKRMPANLQLTYTQARGQKFAQLTNPKKFAEAFINRVPSAKLKRAEACTIGDFKGVLIEFTQIAKGFEITMLQKIVIAPDGSRRIQLIYGTLSRLAKQDMPVLEKAASTLKLTIPESDENQADAEKGE